MAGRMGVLLTGLMVGLAPKLLETSVQVEVVLDLKDLVHDLDLNRCGAASTLTI